MMILKTFLNDYTKTVWKCSTVMVLKMLHSDCTKKVTQIYQNSLKTFMLFFLSSFKVSKNS